MLKSFTSHFYVLNEDHSVRSAPMEEWAGWFNNPDVRRVAFEAIGDAEVSTVFLGLDHSYGNSNRPILFETMVFGSDLNGEMDRCSTWDEAVAMHNAMVSRVWEHVNKLNPHDNAALPADAVEDQPLLPGEQGG